MLKIAKSQSEDTKIAIEELKKAIQNTDTIRTQLSVCKVLAEKQLEELEALKKKTKGLKRARIGCICFSAAGIFTTVMGSIVHKTNPDIGNILLSTGITATACGAGVFALSFSIPF